LTIISFADLLSLSNEYRINTPSTIGNWKIRFKKEFFSEQIAYDLYKITKKYNRI
jgi:4-alpha-glucanotransferase